MGSKKVNGRQPPPTPVRHGGRYASDKTTTIKMTIGYDAKSIVNDVAGIGNYARTLVNDMQQVVPPGTTLYLYAPDRGNDALRRQVTESQSARYVYHGGYNGRLAQALWHMRGIVKDLVRDGVKLYHGLSGELPAGIKEAGIKTVVTIHDLVFMRHPEYYNWIERKVMAWKFRKTCQEADHIIATSECTKRDVMLYGGVTPEKIDVIYQSCGSYYKLPESEKKMQEVHTDYMLPERYIVSVGTIEERKNAILAVKALRLLPDDLSLVIVGKPTSYAEKLKRYVAANGLKRRVMFLHNVPADDMPAIYQMAEACVYPSRYEGFGLPVIEAIQSRLPVVACTGSCLEEAGGNATLYVDPDDVYAMAHAIKLTLKGAPGRDERIAEGLQYISRFENNNVAQSVLNVYEELMK